MPKFPIKYKPGYEHLYKKTRRFSYGNKKKYEFIYRPYPPKDNEENWYLWCEYHNQKLKTDLKFCHNCNRILNPDRYNQSNLLMTTQRSKEIRFIELNVCRKCKISEDKLCKEFEEITKLTKQYRDVAKGKVKYEQR